MKQMLQTAGVVLLVLGLSLPCPALDSGGVDRVVGPEKCGECHKDEVRVWRETKHYKSFYELSRTEEARKITKAMGIKRIKKESVCMGCHFLNAKKDGAVKPIAGISCESCHSPAKDWIKVHNDYGGKGVKKEQETPAHKARRLAAIEASGMIRPSDLYELASNCYGCHLVPREELVNRGGHKPGSAFELVAWSQGEVRHNFFRSQSGRENLASDANRKRLLFVIGKSLELEHGLRGVARATQKADYGIKMAKRTALAIAWIKKINQTTPIPEVADMAAIAGGVKLKLNNAEALNRAADQVARAARKLADAHDGSGWSALDALLPKQDKYKGTPVQ